jgi:A/G-specific adenine glycosylase
VLREDGCILLQWRPARGLLGGMSEVPGTEWRADFDLEAARKSAPKLGKALRWRRLPGAVNHVFTHFPLALTVFAARAPRDALAPTGGRWVSVDKLGQEALPNVMRKVIAHALAARRMSDGGRK